MPGADGPLQAHSEAQVAEEYGKILKLTRRHIAEKFFTGPNLAGAKEVFASTAVVDGFEVREGSAPPALVFLETPKISADLQPFLAPPSDN